MTDHPLTDDKLKAMAKQIAKAITEQESLDLAEKQLSPGAS